VAIFAHVLRDLMFLLFTSSFFNTLNNGIDLFVAVLARSLKSIFSPKVARTSKDFKLFFFLDFSLSDSSFSVLIFNIRPSLSCSSFLDLSFHTPCNGHYSPLNFRISNPGTQLSLFNSNFSTLSTSQTLLLNSVYFSNFTS
jgi:hypothetical protein